MSKTQFIQSIKSNMSYEVELKDGNANKLYELYLLYKNNKNIEYLGFVKNNNSIEIINDFYNKLQNLVVAPIESRTVPEKMSILIIDANSMTLNDDVLSKLEYIVIMGREFNFQLIVNDISDDLMKEIINSNLEIELEKN